MLGPALYQVNTTKQPFDVVLDPARIDLKTYRIKGQGRCPPFINLLVIGSSIGLFAYVNTYFIAMIANVINGSIYQKQTQVFSCDNYFCDQTAYNFITYYSYYKACNPVNCELIICGNYDCNNNQNYGINYYYACQPLCGPLENTSPPGTVQAAFIIAIAAACVFGVGILLGLIYGIISAFISTNLTTLERLALFFSFMWPMLKYYAFRRRQQWEAFYFDLRCMVIIDMIINLCYAVTLALYIALEIYQFWQTGPQIACFYLLIWATILRAVMVSQVAGPFFGAQRQLANMRTNAFNL